jgi:hypothetical protein
MQSARYKMLLGTAMAVIGGVGLGIGLHAWWPITAAAAFAMLVLAIVLRESHK